MFLQPLKSIHCAHSEGSGECRGDDRGNNVKPPDNGFKGTNHICLEYTCIDESTDGFRQYREGGGGVQKE